MTIAVDALWLVLSWGLYPLLDPLGLAHRAALLVGILGSAVVLIRVARGRRAGRLGWLAPLIGLGAVIADLLLIVVYAFSCCAGP
jgi:hypothetical protein